MKTLIPLAILSVVVIVAGCIDNSNTAFFDTPFDIGLQQTRQVGDLTIKLTGVRDDSRCPAGVQCIWAGTANVYFNVVKAGENLGDFHFSVNQNQTLYIDNYKFELLDLKPYPKSGVQLDTSAYVATIKISRK